MSSTLPSTEKGRRTRAAIVEAAATTMYERGVAGTSLDDVLARSGTGKSQLYHYFSGKSELVEAVIDRQLERVLENQPLIDHIDSIDDLASWAETIVRVHEQPGGPFSCPLGSLAVELKNDPAYTPALDAAFQRWAMPLEGALRAMITRGEIDATLDPARTATTLVAALQGGMLLARLAGDVAPLRDLLATTVDSIRRHRTGS